MAQISSDTGGSDYVITGELIDLGTELAKHGKGLADSAGSTKNGNLGRGCGGGREGAGGGLGGGGGGHLLQGGSGGRLCGKHVCRCISFGVQVT